MFEQADAVLYYTDTDRDRLRDLGVGSRIDVIPNGIDTERFRPQGPESDLIDHEGPVVLFIGRLVEGKRPSDAVRAMARVVERHPDAALYLCGEGPLRDNLSALAADIGIADAVTFLGQVPYEEMPAVYRSGGHALTAESGRGRPANGHGGDGDGRASGLQ
jgi:glycosyltransferase involved in cell wall biosynthesis